jgi:hypothetical protein
MYSEKILTEEHVERIFAFENDRRLEGASFDDIMASWSSPWRKESLEHYAKTGWSFFLEDPQTQEVQGFILAQMVVFFRGFTQTLHVEYLSGTTPEARAQLVEIVCKWAKDKHLQRVYLPEVQKDDLKLMPFPIEYDQQNLWAVRTTKA